MRRLRIFSIRIPFKAKLTGFTDSAGFYFWCLAGNTFRKRDEYNFQQELGASPLVASECRHSRLLITSENLVPSKCNKFRGVIANSSHGSRHFNSIYLSVCIIYKQHFLMYFPLIQEITSKDIEMLSFCNTC